MALTLDEIKTAALALPASERESLAEELLLSVSDSERDAVDSAWLAESHRRDADLAAGRTTAKPVDEVIARLAAKARA
jgi:putative addiction module component (TIGR02574 family)